MGDASVTAEGDAPIKPPTVLISYSHDAAEHEQRVLALANRLRAGGVDCVIDLYEAGPAEGWPLWMDRWLRTADFVLVICTETYLRRARGEVSPGRGLGVRWESSQIYRQIYEAAMTNRKFIPCVFTDEDQRFILDPLRSYTHYVIGGEDGYEKLYRRLTGQPETPRPPLGPLRTLPALPPKYVQAAPQAAEPVGPAIERIAPRRTKRVGLVLAVIGVIAMAAAGVARWYRSALSELYATSW